MSISKTQIGIKKEEIIHKLLQQGIEPSVYEITSKLNEFFDIKTPGLPYFAPVKQEAHEVSDPVAYNRMFKDLATDLDVLYKANIAINNKTISMEEYYQSECDGVKSEIEKLQLRLGNLQDTISSGLITKGYSQVFNNFYDIEFDGDESRNIPYTDAFIDLLQKKAYTDKITRAKDKHDITNAELTIKTITSAVNKEEYGNQKYILKDTLNEFYTYVAYTKTQTEFKLSIAATNPAVLDTNSISVSISSSKPITGILSISEDGTNYTDMYEVTGTAGLEWNFATTPVKDFKITLTKSEPDGYNEKNQYEYYFIIKNLSMSKDIYKSKSILVTKPIKFEDLVNVITLKANDLIFPNTSINYYVGLDNGKDKVNWELVENNVPYDLGILKKNMKIINSSSSGYGGAVDTNIYKVCKVPDNVNLNSIKLVPGYQMWYADKFNIAADSSVTNFNIHSFAFDDIVKSSKVVKSQSFIDCDKYDFYIEPKTLYILTQFVNVPDETGANGKYVTTKNSALASGLQTRLLVNGNDIKDANGKYTLRLRKGVNKVQLLLYHNGTSSVQMSHNFNFKECSQDTFALPPMQMVNYHTLRNKTQAPNYKYFAIKDGYLVVKHNPTTITVDSANDMGYMLSYKSLRAEAASLVENTSLYQSVKFRLMAVLLSVDTAMSPQILNFRIIGQ